MDEMKYFYFKDGHKVGPLTFEDLGKLGLPPKTPVWYEGMADWQPISSMDEFIAFYENLKNTEGSVPLTPNPTGSTKNVKPSAKTMFMRLIGLLSGVFGAFMLLSLAGEFDVLALVLGVISIVLSVWIFKSNKVQYKMSGAEKEGQFFQNMHSD